MKKRFLKAGLGVAAAGLAALTLASCGGSSDVFHIYAWNTEFQGFFNKYVSDEKTGDLSKTVHLDGKKVKWTIVPSDNGAYQEALDKALEKNEKAGKGEKVDLFLAEADYILKYTDSQYTKDVTKLSKNAVNADDLANQYQYTVDAASDSKGVLKGVSFQCCPAGVIYRRSIAKAVLGVDEPEQVQEYLNSWEKFDAVAAQAKAKGYYMTASFAETYRAFSNNVSKPWVDDKGKLQFDDQIEAWMEQADKYVDKGYTLTAGVWDNECTAEMAKTGKAFTYFGPAWYYNFCMGPAQDEKTGCYGDWGLIEGPASYFWGGTWMLAANGGDDDELVGKTMKAFTSDEAVCRNLAFNENQFVNFKKVNEGVSSYYDTTKGGNQFLGGQNDTKLYLEGANKIQFKNITIYDQYCNEGLQNKFQEYLKGSVDKATAINNFKTYIKEKCPEVNIG